MSSLINESVLTQMNLFDFNIENLVRVKFTKAFFEDKHANAPFLKAVKEDKIYEARPTYRKGCNFDYRVFVKGNFLQQDVFGFNHWDGVVPANSAEVQVI